MKTFTIEVPFNEFHLDHIFDCGQCFRWQKQEDGSYTGIAFGKVVNMKTTFPTAAPTAAPAAPSATKTLIIGNCNEEDFNNIWKTYLDLDTDYGKIKERLQAQDTVIREAIAYGQGIRILKQDLWETIVSFIISQNNNIPRIKGCIEKLCALAGTSAGTYGEKEYFNIPTPKKLSEMTVETLDPVKLGYRARYLIETAKAVVELGEPKNLEDLGTLCGVGPKVANCISLFGMGNYNSFPIDVWVRRVMNALYDIDEKNIKEMQTFAAEHFGQYGGIAQQYLFYYMRSK